MLVTNKVLTANEIGGVKGGDELIEKCRKLSKLGNSKGKKLAKSKKPSKSENSSNFDVKKAGLSFLTPKAKAAFNCL